MRQKKLKFYQDEGKIEIQRGEQSFGSFFFGDTKRVSSASQNWLGIESNSVHFGLDEKLWTLKVKVNQK
jgi:hypothetical protein